MCYKIIKIINGVCCCSFWTTFRIMVAGRYSMAPKWFDMDYEWSLLTGGLYSEMFVVYKVDRDL
jgi:hypothetical protein